MQLMKMHPKDLYLDLLKKSLSFTLWPEPPIPVTTFAYAAGFLKRVAIMTVSKMLATRDLQLVKKRGFSEYQRQEGRVWPGYADTMIGLKRLDNLQECIESVIEEGIGGDLIETGVWRGGACIFMRGVLAAYQIQDRRVFVADSFQGLPPPAPKRYPADAGDAFHRQEFLRVSEEEVRKNFARYGLLDEQVVFLKGWFKDTLPTAPITRLSILRLDGDMYESTLDALTHLYPTLSPGGFCIIDDYAEHGCRQAVDDYRDAHQIRDEMHIIDWTGRYWKKSA
ncbi:macrocin O-methyltransferase [candidate division KSB3 bacterium]|uniref:Macrocin O-methyltransferase n=1 Tax=candidate division KSB3 bacterium TaxID=2044937 RepID=A0A9D5JV84_9BACT|nr:macrocin O-methyltransferase [candidate division KSB3 bacterium]MBD3324296.1 macrocin O-methyltransferase [candidate division KSB3 bacterium]